MILRKGFSGLSHRNEAVWGVGIVVAVFQPGGDVYIILQLDGCSCQHP